MPTDSRGSKLSLAAQDGRGNQSRMEISVEKPWVRLLVLVISLVIAGVIAFTAGEMGYADALNRMTNPEDWARAAEIESGYGKYWARLGRYRQYDLEGADPLLAVEYYEKAVRDNPRSSDFWMELGSALEQAGHMRQAQNAFEQAAANYPLSAEVKWNYGNFLLRRGDIDGGALQLRQALEIEPKLRPLAISRCWESKPEVDFLLDKLLPAQADAYLDALDYLGSIHQVDAGEKVWARLLALKQPFPLESTFSFFDEMIQENLSADGRRMWRQAFDANRLPYTIPADGSVIWNGGFEYPVAGGGFGWTRYGIPGAEIEPDTLVRHSGKQSMRIDFGGGSNLDFFHLFQFVPVQPDQTYHFQAWMRTKDITTDSGLRFYISDPNNRDAVRVLTPSITGTTPWTAVDADVTTGLDTHVLLLQVRRLPSQFFDNRISGAAWVDDVALVPSSAESKANGS